MVIDDEGSALLTRRACLLAGLAGTWPAVARGSERVIRFGLTPVFLDERVRPLLQWRQLLTSALGVPVEFVQRSTYAQILDALRSGQVHFAWICGYPYVLHQRELQLVAVPQWRGNPTYQSYLIADRRLGLRSLAELRGRTFAYSDPLSNSGFLYPQHLLRERGVDPGRYFGRTFFTHSHRHVVQAVADGLAQAGAVDGYVWETLAELMPSLVEQTAIVQKSPAFGFPPIVAASGVSAHDRNALATALFEMPGHEAGRSVLAELRLDRFVSVDASLFDGIALMARGQARAG